MLQVSRQLVLLTSVVVGICLFLLVKDGNMSISQSQIDSLHNKLTGLSSHTTETGDSSVQAYFERRLDLSESKWEKSVQDRQAMLAASNPAAAPKFPDVYYWPFSAFDFVRPTYSCPHELERVGRFADGGKWVCGMSKYEQVFPPVTSEAESSAAETRKKMIMYAFGINHDSSFESEILKRTNAEVWGYDMTVQGWAREITPDLAHRAHFTKAGIAGETNASANPPFFSLQDVMKSNGHTFIDLLKIDIEGSEWDTFLSFFTHLEGLNQNVLPIGQMLIEVHLNPKNGLPNTPQNVPEWLKWFAELERFGMRPSFTEDNFSSMWQTDCARRYTEYTLINAKQKEQNVILHP